jgi:hypothetical protein
MAGDTPVPDPHAHVDSIQLRLIAEAASGLRGEPVHFVAGPKGGVREFYPHEKGGALPRDLPPGDELVVIPALTQDVAPLRPPLTTATIQAQGVALPIDLLNLPNGLGAADAVFWSESSVEKFLIPYYASVYGNQAARAVGDILEAFHGDRGGGPPASGGRLTDPDALTYAMAHIPKSEYVTLADSTDVGASLAVIFEDPAAPGTVNALRLPDFIRWRKERRG